MDQTILSPHGKRSEHQVIWGSLRWPKKSSKEMLTREILWQAYIWMKSWDSPNVEPFIIPFISARNIHHVSKFCDGPLFKPVFLIFSAICYYSAASTADSAYIIGGLHTSEVVAEFRNNEWKRLKDLSKARYGHGSLSVGEQTIIIGGGTYPSATWV